MQDVSSHLVAGGAWGGGGPANPQDLNRYSYALNNPVRFTDPTGHFLDTLLDVGFIAYGVYDIAANGYTHERGISLAADVIEVIIPGVTGLGAAVRVANRADDAIAAARAAQLAADARKADEARQAAATAAQAEEAARKAADAQQSSTVQGTVQVWWSGCTPRSTNVSFCIWHTRECNTTTRPRRCAWERVVLFLTAWIIRACHQENTLRWIQASLKHSPSFLTTIHPVTLP